MTSVGGQQAPGSEPLISVITICRDAGALIERTARSVLEQSYESLEYVVVDGGSTDGTTEVLKRLETEFADRRFRWSSSPDSGIADAMNRGVGRSQGEVIVHLHAGDWFIDEHVLRRVMRTFVFKGWRWAVASSVAVDENARRLHVYRPDPDHRRLLKQNTLPHQSTFLVRDVFERHGPFRTDFRQASDYEYWLRIALLGGERYHVLPFETTNYLSGGGSADIRALLSAVRHIRRELRSWQGRGLGVSDYVFLGRIAAFWAIHFVARPVVSRIRATG